MTGKPLIIRLRSPSKERVVAPGPRGHVLLGKLLQIRRDRLRFVTEMAREFGGVVRFRMGARVLHLVSNPDGIRYVLNENHANYRKGVGLAEARTWLGDGLVTSEGRVWARHRRLMQPAFNPKRVRAFGPLVVDATSDLVAQWRSAAAERRAVDVASDLTQLTLNIITRAMFNTRLEDVEKVGAAFSTALHDAMSRMTAVVLLPDWIPFPGKLRFRRAVRTLKEIVHDVVRKHRKGTIEKDNLVSILLSEEDGRGDSLSDKEVHDEVMTILLAGHETTASSLAWTFFLLAQNPWAWRRLRDEVEEVLAEKTPEPGDLPKLSWMGMVFKESLRLYPPVWMIPRRAISDDEICGFHVPADSDVLISPYVLHRDPRRWEQPEAFSPGRFSEEGTHIQPESYLPFGRGPRACIGSAFATMEALLILVMCVQNFRLELSPSARVVPEPLLTLRFRYGLEMNPVELH